jgi:hypothetical protein
MTDEPLWKTIGTAYVGPHEENGVKYGGNIVYQQLSIPSPFLPDTKIQYAWDSTCLGLLKTCPRLYQYVILEGWTPHDENIHLRFGIEVHTALQEYDVSRSNGVNHEDSIHDVISALMGRTYNWDVDRASKAGRYKNRETLVSLVVDYLDHFGTNDPAETYIKADGTPAVELSFQFALDWGPAQGIVDHSTFDDGGYQEKVDEQPYLLCGHLDRVVTLNGALLVMDRKTTQSTPGPYYFNQYEPNNQMSLYTLAGKIVLGTPVRGVCIDAMQVLLEEPNCFVRGFTYRTPDQLNEWLVDLGMLLAHNEGYAEQGYYPMNDTACDKFGGCKFRDICSKSPSIRERFLRADFTQLPPEERWNPLKPR